MVWMDGSLLDRTTNTQYIREVQHRAGDKTKCYFSGRQKKNIETIIELHKGYVKRLLAKCEYDSCKEHVMDISNAVLTYHYWVEQQDVYIKLNIL